MLQPGDAFPDIELTDHDGNAWSPSMVQGQPLVLILHRHLA